MSSFLSGKQIQKEINERIDNLPFNPLPGSGCDEFGYNPEELKKYGLFAHFLYRYWFRVDLHGAENIPDSGACIIVPNHSGQLPFDGLLITVGCLTEKKPPRLPRAMVEKWMPTLPVISTIMRNCGQVVGVQQNADRILETGEIMLVFPEGSGGSGKTWDKRYQLQKFGIGFIELAIRHNVPIIPTAVIGAEEQAPSLINATTLAKMFHAPYFPITANLLLFGIPLGIIPLPSTYHIYFGEPMHYGHRRGALDDPAELRAISDEVKARIQSMINEGLEKRILPGL